MIKSYLSLVCLFVLLISATTVSAQLSIKLAGKTYKIPKFIKTLNVTHHVIPFTLKLDSQFISYHILEPLSSSPYPFEVRCSSSGITDPGYTMNVLKANKDSLWWERYEMYITTTLVKGATKSIEIKKDSQGHPIYNGYMPMGNPDVKELAEASKLVNTFLYIASDR